MRRGGDLRRAAFKHVNVTCFCFCAFLLTCVPAMYYSGGCFGFSFYHTRALVLHLFLACPYATEGETLPFTFTPYNDGNRFPCLIRYLSHHHHFRQALHLFLCCCCWKKALVVEVVVGGTIDNVGCFSFRVLYYLPPPKSPYLPACAFPPIQR